MWYAIVAEDAPDSLQLRLEKRPEHLERLKLLQQAGRLLLAGPFPAIDSVDPGSNGYSGSLIVAEFDNLEQAQVWAENDPFSIHGVYSKVSVKPFRKTLP
jgi:uncharacterized protein YciI